MSSQRFAVNLADPALAALAAMPADRPVALLHSGRPHRRWARRSILAQPLAWYRYTAEQGGVLTGLQKTLTGRVFDDLRALLNDPALPGRWFGYLGYELAHLIEPAKLGPPPAGDWPLVELGYCPDWQELPVADPQAESERTDAPGGSTLASNFTRPDYEAAVQRAIDYIAAGDVFQVNLSQRFAGTWQGRPRDLYQRLASVSPAWYGAYCEVGGGKWEVGSGQAEAKRASATAASGPPRALLSTSPELFLEVDGRRVVTRPIKGTRPTSDTRHPTSDIEALRSSAKDAAELNMIVDLMRNDLGRVCDYGSVRVTEPRTIETHPTVHHGVSTIEGTLHPSRDIVDLLRATLPGGSITGAPKVRAMQIIRELEPDPRGPYCGCIGWLSKDACQLNIAIRTMTLAMSEAGSRMSDGPQAPHPTSDIPHPTYSVAFNVGGGVVADSNPADEYDETLTKARAMLAALGQA